MKKTEQTKFRTAKEIGDYGERKAARYLMRRGYWIKERNYRSGKYEIDLIAISLRSILFVEVKTRSYNRENATGVPPSHAVDADKIRFTRAAAKNYLRNHPTAKMPRMDVIEVWLANGKVYKIQHLPGAY